MFTERRKVGDQDKRPADSYSEFGHRLSAGVKISDVVGDSNSGAIPKLHAHCASIDSKPITIVPTIGHHCAGM